MKVWVFCILKHLHLNDSFQDERWRKGDGGDNGANEIDQCQNGAQLVGPPVCRVVGGGKLAQSAKFTHSCTYQEEGRSGWIGSCGPAS